MAIGCSRYIVSYFYWNSNVSYCYKHYFLLQVRLSLIQENGAVETKRLSKHQGRVHSLAIEPGSPYVFYSCGEDGFVQHVGFLSAAIHTKFPLNSLRPTPYFFCSTIYEVALLQSFSIPLHLQKTVGPPVLG